MPPLHDSSDAKSPPRRPLRRGLAEKLAAFAFVSAFVTSLALTWAAIDSTELSLDKIIRRQVPDLLRRVADRHVSWIRSGERSLEAFAAHLTEPQAEIDPQPMALSGPRVARHLDVAVRNPSLPPLLAKWVETSPQFRGVAIVAAGGETLLASGAFDREAFASAAPGSETPHLRASEAPNRQFAVTPLSAGFPPGSSLVGDYRPLTLNGVLQEDSPLPGATLALFDPLGSFLLTARDPRVPSASDETGVRRLPASALGQVREYRNESGEHVIGCAMPFGLFGWRIAVEVPFDVAYEPVMSAATRMLAIELCIVLTFSFVAYRITTVMLRPIKVLSDDAQLIAAGVIDHEVAETGRDDEIGLLGRSFNKMMRNLRRDRQELEEAHRELVKKNLDLKRANEVLNQLSITDGLTKIHNHRFFQDHLTREIKRVNRLREPLAMILIDADDFKSLNDRFGHATGDEVLVRLARIMESTVRETDLLARYGGEEFAIIASSTDSIGAYQLAEKIRTNIAETSFTIGETMRTMRITVSIGVAQYRGNRKRFFKAADRALYSAKAEGKNCVVVDAAADGETIA